MNTNFNVETPEVKNESASTLSDLKSISPKSIEGENPVRNFRKPLSEEVVQKIQLRSLALQHAASRTGAEFMAKADAFVTRHLDSPVFNIENNHAWRVQRTIAGIGLNLSKGKPVEIRRAEEGVLLVEWNEKGKNIECRARWEGEELPGRDLLEIAKRAATLFGGYDEKGGALIGALIVSELFEGNDILPEFSLTPIENGFARWIWKYRYLDVKEEDYQAAKVELSRINKKDDQKTKLTPERDSLEPEVENFHTAIKEHMSKSRIEFKTPAIFKLPKALMGEDAMPASELLRHETIEAITRGTLLPFDRRKGFDLKKGRSYFESKEMLIDPSQISQNYDGFVACVYIDPMIGSEDRKMLAVAIFNPHLLANTTKEATFKREPGTGENSLFLVNYFYDVDEISLKTATLTLPYKEEKFNRVDPLNLETIERRRREEDGFYIKINAPVVEAFARETEKDLGVRTV